MEGRIVVCKEYGTPFEIEACDVPAPEAGAVLLRMTQAGICGSELHRDLRQFFVSASPASVFSGA